MENIKDFLSYDPDTGVFVWIKSKSSKAKAGSIAGSMDRDKYILISFNSKRYPAHRLAWYFVYNTWPTNMIDHINGNPSDNRISNLRDVSCAENLQNMRKPTKRNKTGYLGVSLFKRINKFQARICVNYKEIHLGYYDSADEAYKVYLDAKRRLHKTCSV